jgi:hypothetical protein
MKSNTSELKPIPGQRYPRIEIGIRKIQNASNRFFLLINTQLSNGLRRWSG